jgi:hypothetical protein
MFRSRTTPPTPPPEPSYSVALVEARRGLDGQLAVVEATRSRALNLLGTGGLLGTFVAGLGAFGSDSKEHMTGALWWAAGAFAVAVVMALVVVFPYRFHSTLNPAVIVTEVPTMTASETDKWLAERIGQQYDDNAGLVAGLQMAAMVAVAAVGVEFVALGFQLVRSR